MLIGQAPGWREIETGLPFAWDAGKRLCGWLAAAGIGVDDFRQRWYVTSIGEVLSRAGARARRSTARRRGPKSRAGRPTCARSCASSGRGWSCSSAGLRIGSRSAPSARLDELVGRELAWEAAPDASVLCLPHPSGASTWLNDPARVELWRRGIGLLRDRWAELGA